MCPDEFDHMAQLLQPVIEKQITNFRQSICVWRKIRSYTSLTSARWFSTVSGLGSSYWQRNNFQNNKKNNNQRNKGSFERGLFEATQEVTGWKAVSKEFENLGTFHIESRLLTENMFPLNALNYLAPSILITKVSLVWYCSQFAMQNVVLLMLTLVNMEGQTTVASWEVLVYTKRLRKTNSMCQLHRKLKGLKIHCPTFFLGTRYFCLGLD